MAEIRDYNGRPAIMIDGVAYPPMMATIRTNNRENMVIDREYYRELGAAGVKIFFLICDTTWLKPKALEMFDEEARVLLEEVPDAYIVPRIGLHPNNEWIEAHPEECITYSDGTSPEVLLYTESYEKILPHHYSLCSEKWREDAGVALADTWKAIMALPYADRIIGCFLAAGGTSEWYYMLGSLVNQNGATLDHSLAFKRNFVKYLREKYVTDENLRRAWKNDTLTIDNPTIPEAAKHYFANEVDLDSNCPKEPMWANAPVPPPYGNGTNIGAFADPDNSMDVIDFYTAWHKGSAESVLYFANVVKSITPTALVGAFYGAHGCTEFLQTGTCGGVPDILNSNLVDFLAAPGVYENRQPGGFVGQREMHDSFALKNKIYIIEDDTRTHFENRYFAPKNGMYDMRDSVNVMKREFGRTICEDVHAWWFDQLLGGKRYKHPELYKLISEQQKIGKEAYEKDRRKASEIAFIYDSESILSVSSGTTKELIERHRNCEIARIGAPVDQYYHNDMSDPNMPAYKMYVFFNTFVLTDSEREVIRAKLKKDNAVALWMYAPGIINPDRDKKFDTAHMKELTGIEIDCLNENFDANLRFDVDSEVTDGLSHRRVYGNAEWDRKSVSGVAYKVDWNTYLYPYFFSTDKSAEELAHFVTSGKCAVSLKADDGFTSIFYGSKSIRSDVLRTIAKYAGCHIYTDSEDVFFANKSYITFHASNPGEKVIKLREKCTVREVYENKIYGENITELRFTADVGDTKMFEMSL